MPLNDEKLMGDNGDGTKNQDYCTYCFKDGDFTGDATMEEMIEICVPHMIKQGFEEKKAREMMNNLFPNLKRWSK
jgi:hypothetical protein